MPDRETEQGQVDNAAPEQSEQSGEHGLHEAPEGAPVHPLIDLNRDPTPGKPDHARPEH